MAALPGDVQLTAFQVEPAPLDYLVPQSALVRLKSVRAEFRDNGAAGDWLPAVEIVSDSGHVIVTASDQGAKVTAGGDSDASFFPGAAKGAAASTASVLEVAYYEWNGASTGAIPGTRKFNVSLTSSSNTAVFDANAGSARVKVAGAIQAYAFIDWGATETVTGGAIAEYRFGLDFPVFPFYTVGGPWKTIPATPTVLVYDTEVTGEFYVSAPTLTMRPFVRSPAMAPGGDPAGVFLVLEKLRDTWAF